MKLFGLRLAAWLLDVLQYARETWREDTELRRKEAEAEYDRQNPVFVPSPWLQTMWSKEIVRQMSPVLRFEQIVKEMENREEDV